MKLDSGWVISGSYLACKHPNASRRSQKILESKYIDTQKPIPNILLNMTENNKDSLLLQKSPLPTPPLEFDSNKMIDANYYCQFTRKKLAEPKLGRDQSIKSILKYNRSQNNISMLNNSKANYSMDVSKYDISKRSMVKNQDSINKSKSFIPLNTGNQSTTIKLKDTASNTLAMSKSKNE